MRRLRLLVAVAFLAGCTGGEPVEDAPEGAISSAVTTTFGAGALIIPMDISSNGQASGMLRAYGLVYELLRQGIPVHWVIDPAKAANGDDFVVQAGATVVDFRPPSAPVTLPRGYRGGPFVIASADAAAAVPVIEAWQGTPGDTTRVHRLVTGSLTNLEVASTLRAAPRIAILKDGFESIAFNDLNAAGIRDSVGNLWTASSPDQLTHPDVAGATTSIHTDGALFHASLGAPRYCHAISTHVDVGLETTATLNEVVAEFRSWLDVSPQTSLFLQCESTRVFENAPAGFFLTNAGLDDDGSAPAVVTTRAPSDPRIQIDGAFAADTGATDSMKAVDAPGAIPDYKTGVTTLLNESSALLTDRIVLMTGHLDGVATNGKVTMLAGHDYSLALPVSSNPQTNGVRILLNALLDAGCASAVSNTAVTVTAAAPAILNASTVPSRITVTLTVTNPTTTPAENMRLTLPLPAGATFVSATGGGTHASGTVTWDLAPLAAGAPPTSVTVTMGFATDGTYVNQATLRYAQMTTHVLESNEASTERETVPPAVTLGTAEPALSNDTTGEFAFTANETSTFECRVDADPFAPCVSPFVTSPLADGAHAFQVRATDSFGNVSTAVTANWTVDTAAPDTMFTSTEPNPTSDATGEFELEATEVATFECSLDGGAFVACATPYVTIALGDTSHSLSVRAVDGALNADPSPSLYAWIVDTLPPDTSLDAAPAALTNVAIAEIGFSSNEQGATFECALDGAAFEACAAPFTTSALADGAHSIEVRALDAAANVDPIAATAAWTVDTTPPDTQLVSSPGESSSDERAVFEFSASEAGATFLCTVDQGAPAACASPFITEELEDGAHVFEVRAVDAAGNADASATQHVWDVDTSVGGGGGCGCHMGARGSAKQAAMLLALAGLAVFVRRRS